MRSHKTLSRLAFVLAIGLAPSLAPASPAGDGDAVVRQARRNKIEFSAPMQVKCEWRSDRVPATAAAVNGALRKRGFTFSVEMAKATPAAKPAHVLNARKIGVLSENDLSALVQEVEGAAGGIGAFSWSVAQK